MSDFVGAMPTRRDVEISKTDGPNPWVLGKIPIISPIMMTSGFESGANWHCTICKESGGGYPLWAMMVLMSDIHVLNHKEYLGIDSNSIFNRLIAEELRSIK